MPWNFLASYSYAFPAWPPLIVAACLSVMTLMVVYRERMSRISRTFGALCACVILWLVSIGAIYSTSDRTMAMFWSKYMLVGITFIPVFLLRFSMVLTKTMERYSWLLRAVWVLAFFWLFFGVNSPHVISGLKRFPWGLYPQAGGWGSLFVLYFYAGFSAALAVLWRAFRSQSLEPQRSQLRDFVMAFAVGALATVDFIAAYDRLVYPVGFLPLYASLLILGQIIWRYRFADITPSSVGADIMETTPTPLWVLDTQGVISLVNRAGVEDFGVSEKDLIGKSIATIFPTLWTSSNLASLHEQSRLHLDEIPYLKAQQPARWYSLSISAVKDALGHPLAYVCVALDQTAHRETEQRRRLYSDIVEHMQTGIVVLSLDDPNDDRSLRIIAANPAATVAAGTSFQALIGKKVTEFFPNLYHTPAISTFLEAARLGREVDLGDVHYGDARVPESVFSVKVFPLPGQCMGLAFDNVTARVVTEKALEQAQEAARIREARFRQLLNANIIGFAITTLDGQILEANEATLELIGYSKSDLNEQRLDFATLTAPEFHPVREWFRQKLRDSGICSPVEKELVHKDGHRVPVLVGAVRLEGAVNACMCFILDVSERRAAQVALRKAYDELELRVEQRTQDLKEEIDRRRQAEEALRQLSLTDVLTGLYNRRGFLMRAEQQIQIARRENSALYLFMMDLDGLKPINDTFGHLEGDQAIKEAGAMLKANFRAVDVVARIGGDEFAVLMVDDASQKPEDSLNRLKERLEEHHRLHGRAYRLDFSIGIAVTHPEETFNLDHLISKADAALYEQKRQKGGRQSAPQPPTTA